MVIRWTTFKVGLCCCECEFFVRRWRLLSTTRLPAVSSLPDEVVGGFFCDFECSLSTRSERPQNRKKDHPRPALPQTPSTRRRREVTRTLWTVRVELRLLVVQDHVHQIFRLHLCRINIPEVVAAALELLRDGQNRPEDVEVRGRACGGFACCGRSRASNSTWSSPRETMNGGLFFSFEGDARTPEPCRRCPCPAGTRRW